MASAFAHVRNLVAGFFMGAASQLPGVSGGTVGVIFGVYERLIRDLDKLFSVLRKEFMFLLMLGLGILLGMWLPSYGIEWLTDNAYFFAMFMFIGFVVGQIPDVYGEVVKERRRFRPLDALPLVIGFIIAASTLFIDGGTTEFDHSAKSIVLVFVCGIVLALSKLMPGISGSTVLLMLGLYEDFYIRIFTDTDIVLLIPLVLGLLIGILGFSKLIRYVLDHHRTAMYLMVFGLTLGSIVAIYPGVYSTEDLLFGFAGLAVGIAVSLALSFFAKKIAPAEPGPVTQ